MTYQQALELVVGAAREMAQIRSDDADISDEQQKEIDELWEAIERIGSV